MVQKWPNRQLEEVCAFQNGLWTGKRPPFVTAKVIRNTNFKNNDGTLNLGDVAEIEVEEKQLKNRLLEKGDLILERSGGGPTQPVGRVVYFDAGGKFSFSNFTTRIRVRNSKELDSVYLWRYLNLLYLSGVTEKMQKQTTGIRNLNFPEYKNLEILLPPIAEQKKIVARLEGLLGKIKEAKRLRAEAQEAAQDLLPAELHRIFTQSTTPHKQHTNKLQFIGMSGSRQKWEEKELGEVCELNMGQSPSSSTYNSNQDGLPFYQGKKDYGEKYPTPRVWCSNPIKIVEAGDILISVRAPVGALNIAREKSCIGRGLAGLRSGKNLEQGILYYFLTLKQKDISDMGTGSTFTAVSKKHLENIKIPLPPVEEQKKIVARLDSLSEKIKNLREYQKSTASDFISLEQSILHKAFSGKV